MVPLLGRGRALWAGVPSRPLPPVPQWRVGAASFQTSPWVLSGENKKSKLHLDGLHPLQKLTRRLTGRVPKSVLRQIGLRLSTQCSRQVDVVPFFKDFGMPNSYYSWYLVAELHLWLMSVRIMGEDSKESLELANEMLLFFWVDAEEK